MIFRKRKLDCEYLFVFKLRTRIEIFIFHRTVSQIVRLQIISGQNLPKFEKKVIDPYVTVQIMGHPADRLKFKTKPVEDNGTCDTFFE